MDKRVLLYCLLLLGFILFFWSVKNFYVTNTKILMCQDMGLKLLLNGSCGVPNCEIIKLCKASGQVRNRDFGLVNGSWMVTNFSAS